MTNDNKNPGGEEATLEAIVERLTGVKLDVKEPQPHYSGAINGREFVVAKTGTGYVVSFTEPLVSAHIKTLADLEKFKKDIDLAQEPLGRRSVPRQENVSQNKPAALQSPQPTSTHSQTDLPTRPPDMPQFEDEYEIFKGPRGSSIPNPAVGVGESDLYPFGKYPSFEPGMPGGQGGMHPIPFGQTPRFNQRWDPPAPGAADPRDPTTGVDSAGDSGVPNFPKRGEFQGFGPRGGSGGFGGQFGGSGFGGGGFV